MAPPLLDTPPTQVGEAIRIGPGGDARLRPAEISDQQLSQIAAYLRFLRTRPHPAARPSAGSGRSPRATSGGWSTCRAPARGRSLDRAAAACVTNARTRHPRGGEQVIDRGRDEPLARRMGRRGPVRADRAHRARPAPRLRLRWPDPGRGHPSRRSRSPAWGGVVLWAQDLMDTPIVVEERHSAGLEPGRGRRVPGGAQRGGRVHAGDACWSGCSWPRSPGSGRPSRCRSCRSGRRRAPSSSRQLAQRASASSAARREPGPRRRPRRRQPRDRLSRRRDRLGRQPGPPDPRPARAPPARSVPGRPGRPTGSSPTRRSAPTPAARSGCIGPPSAQLICPCHQSTFDVLDRGDAGLRAGRAGPCPSFRSGCEADGTFIALGDFPRAGRARLLEPRLRLRRTADCRPAARHRPAAGDGARPARRLARRADRVRARWPRTRPAQGLPGSLVVPARRGRPVLLRRPDRDRGVPDVLLRGRHPAGHLRRPVCRAARRPGFGGVRLGDAALVRGPGGATDAPDPSLGRGRVRGRDHRPRLPDLLHRARSAGRARSTGSSASSLLLWPWRPA